jgi:hypothetical protein
MERRKPPKVIVKVIERVVERERDTRPPNRNPPPTRAEPQGGEECPALVHFLAWAATATAVLIGVAVEWFRHDGPSTSYIGLVGFLTFLVAWIPCCVVFSLVACGIRHLFGEES